VIEHQEVPSELLMLASYYAQETYNESPHFKNRLTGAGGFIWYEGNTQIIGFRGSSNAQNWIMNATAVPVPWLGGWVHGGFRAYHSSIWGEMKREIDPDRETRIIGHSLGGAGAEQARAWMAKKKNAKVDMVTFGKPNVWFRAFSPRVKNDGLLVSVVHGSDLVTRIPRYSYRPTKGQLMLYFGNDEVDRWEPSYETRRKDWCVGDSISDHMLPTYQKRMDTFIRNRGKT